MSSESKEFSEWWDKSIYTADNLPHHEKLAKQAWDAATRLAAGKTDLVSTETRILEGLNEQ